MTQTLKSNPLNETQIRRLSWRCRRGLLELDIVLQRFSECHLATLSLDELMVLNALLDLPDNEFLDVITTRKCWAFEGQHQALETLLTKLRAQ